MSELTKKEARQMILAAANQVIYKRGRSQRILTSKNINEAVCIYRYHCGGKGHIIGPDANVLETAGFRA